MKDTTNVLYSMRRRMNLTQRQIAQQTGLTANDISRLERGITTHRIEKIITLSKHLDIPVESLINNDLKTTLICKKPKKVSRKISNT